MLREDPTLYFYSVEASAEPGGAPVWIKRDNPYHGAAAAIADGAAHASTSHGSVAGQQPDVAVSCTICYLSGHLPPNQNLVLA